MNAIAHIFLFIALYFEVFLLISFFENRSRERVSRRAYLTTPLTSSALPSVTIMVPCYNEEHTVTNTILSILKLDYPQEKLNVIVINDGSTDHTWDTLQQFADDPQIMLLSKENGGKHTALNEGLKHVSTELVGCLDADSYVASDALRIIAEKFEDPTVMCVTPGIKLNNPRKILELIQKAEYALSVFIRKTFASIDSLFITPGPFSIFRTSVFEALGNYREAYNTEDMEIALRMQSNHYKIANAPDAHVFTNPPKTISSLFRQRLRWTYGFLNNARDYRYMFFNRKYGTLGIFVLPTALFSILPALFFTALIIDSGLRFIFGQVERVQAVGINVNAPSFTFDPFFISTQSLLILVYAIIAITVALIMIGKRWSSDRIMGFDVPLYVFLYGFLAPWWLGKAVLDTVRSKKQSWTAEINSR